MRRYFKGWARAFATGVFILAWAPAGVAGQADVVGGAAEPMKNGMYVIIATIRHGDESFDHFADRYEVVGPDGAVIATRVLVHPHVDEQPFTRALARVAIPSGISEITIRAHDRRHGFSGKELVVKLPGR